MKPVILAGPAVEPVSLAEMKAHLRLDTDDEDGLLASLIAAARGLVERRCRLLLVTQSWRVTLDGWPDGRRVALPLAPLLAVTAVRITGAGGTAVTLDPALYRLDAGLDPGGLAIDAAAPVPGVPVGGIEVDATYGFGPDAAAVPAPLRLAIRRLAAAWFEHRGDGPDRVVPVDVDTLLAPYRRPRLA